MSDQTELYVWDIGAGVAIYVKTPNGKHTVIDCGASDDFSPTEYIKNNLEVKQIDYLIISHPHKDHIKDLEGIKDLEKDHTVLRRNKDIKREIMIQSNKNLKGDEDLDRYFQLVSKYTQDVKDEESPRNPDWGEECIFKCFSNKYSESGEVTNSTINNLSVVTFIKFGDDVVLYGGDVEEKGWEDLLERYDLEELLKATTIYIASHHGNKSGFSSELFKHLNPKLTVISSSTKREYDAADKYCDKTKGMTIDGETRKVVTTRSDGNIHITLYDDTEPKVELDCESKT